MFSLDDLARMRAAVMHAAQAELMPRFGRLRDDDIARKTSAFDLVTAADEAGERALVERLSHDYPGAEFVGEESTHADPRRLDRLGAAALCFVIDPLDGTRNFAAGVPLFGVMVAAVARGQVVAGVIHDPVTGGTSLALRGQGAWHLDAHGARAPLRVAPPVPLEAMEGVVATHFLPEPRRSQVNARLSRLGMTNWFRCAAQEYRLAASGQCHVLFYNKLMPWDHAAGWLIHQEAGGFSAHFDGTPYRPVHTTGGLLCAPDEGSWHAVCEALLGAS